ncbi:MAG: DUF2251 domain-containing protein [Gemmatimonadales bacterium]
MSSVRPSSGSQDLEAPGRILDAVQIYAVRNVVDRELPSDLEVVWSEDGQQAALLLNSYPHAVFDFEARRGYCRTGFPSPPDGWSRQGHAWDDEALRPSDGAARSPVAIAPALPVNPELP